MFAINDPLDLAASLATYLGFLALLGLTMCARRLDRAQLLRVFLVMCIGLACINWGFAMLDTAALHLAHDDWWPEWGYWRRVFWRPLQTVVLGWCYVDCLLWLRVHRNQGTSGAQKPGHSGES